MTRDLDLPALLQALQQLRRGPRRRNERRWVPIGPSVIMQGQFVRTTGRIRDIRVSEDGKRAYAASAKGGVWYTRDAGATWAPVTDLAGYAPRDGVVSAQACGCLLVEFDQHDEGNDFVMVGTGEAMVFTHGAALPDMNGIGVLAGRGPAVRSNAWEVETGATVLAGVSIYRLARKPRTTPGRAAAPSLPRDAAADCVVAATTAGLFRGRRMPGPPGQQDRFDWQRLVPAGAFTQLPPGTRPRVTDVIWVPISDTQDRIIVAIASAENLDEACSGVAYSDDDGATFRWVPGLDGRRPSEAAVGRMSLAAASDAQDPYHARVYALGEVKTGKPSTATKTVVWQIGDSGAQAPTATRLNGTKKVWHYFGALNQRDYDQAITAVALPDGDRLFLGGNVAWRTAAYDSPASLWCYTVAPPNLMATVGVSTPGSPPNGAGADPAGMIGDGVHVDVHAIAVTSDATKVWVACDGGVYVSVDQGRVNTFVPRSNGIGAVESGFVASHPTSSHYVAVGCQDNGVPCRVGDVVWQDVKGGDGGGVAFHASQGHRLLLQSMEGSWHCEPSAGFVGPPSLLEWAAMYSGAASIKRDDGGARMALGTNRVWLTDDLGVRTARGEAKPNTWRVLPFPSGAAVDPGPDDPDALKYGVPGGHPLPDVKSNGWGKLGTVITVKWASPTELLALFDLGVVRWSQTADIWTAELLLAQGLPSPTSGPNVAEHALTDVAPVPHSRDFYLTTRGNPRNALADTCFFFENATRTFHPTGLRRALDSQGAGPRDPAFSVVVDPADVTRFFVGTVTGVWEGVRTDAAHSNPMWTLLDNGLPRVLIQDLNIWHDPAGPPGTPRLLRAASQSRGVWEVDLTGDEPQRTYVRVHRFDDRRRFPTPMADPTAPEHKDLVAYASPDIVVRPGHPQPRPPIWPRRNDSAMDDMTSETLALWAFQTAFRWIVPGVVSNGNWTDSFGRLVERFRGQHADLLPARPEITKKVWDTVVGRTYIDPAGNLASQTTGHLAVFRPPWQGPAAMDAAATEADLVDYLVAATDEASFKGEIPDRELTVLKAFNEPSTVDVLIHHRDTQPLPRGDAFCLLLWRPARTVTEALHGGGGVEVKEYVAKVIAREVANPSSMGPAPVPPATWTVASAGPGLAAHRLRVPLEARMPRAVSVDVDLTNVAPGSVVLFLAVVGSTVDPCAAAPNESTPGEPTSLVDLVRRWPYAALRLVTVASRTAGR